MIIYFWIARLRAKLNGLLKLFNIIVYYSWKLKIIEKLKNCYLFLQLIYEDQIKKEKRVEVSLPEENL